MGFRLAHTPWESQKVKTSSMSVYTQEMNTPTYTTLNFQDLLALDCESMIAASNIMQDYPPPMYDINLSYFDNQSSTTTANDAAINNIQLQKKDNHHQVIECSTSTAVNTQSEPFLTPVSYLAAECKLIPPPATESSTYKVRL